MPIYSDEIHVKEFKTKLLEISQHEIGKHIVPLFKFTQENGYEHQGSGVFVKIRDEYFLFTATHVVWNERKNEVCKIFIPTVSGVIPLRGLVVCETKLDKDVAFIVINKPIAELMLFSFNCLPQNKIALKHHAIPFHHYVFIGFPEERVTKDNNMIRYESIIYVARPSPQKVYKYYEKDLNNYLILDIGKVVDEKGDKSSLSGPYGMSGGGLFYVGFNIINNSMRLFYELIGIVPEYKKGKYYVFISTKIDVLMETIDHYFNHKSEYNIKK